ncbi:hypothetical protein G7092_17125 [Mucilaginibacter sp. HC2]|uniref:hypothetical protein n=1 Tax=Mucilaginibacter inviolabilis TaxID=2714892 RepID=UPI000DCEB1E2|nr:hypothetical protein [Mucilaginibacter inviolabilis]NHA05536.1 hypothetical protein [Mucilaginibacter inviolabilis]RAV59454.1 hypothetical protein DIU36_06395 [Mucilaginibacter rubeus]
MNQHIVYNIHKPSGTIAEIKIVPETKPGVNGRISITGVFRLFHMIPKDLAPPPRELDIDAYMAFAGSLRFLNENFYEWRYEGDGLCEMEITQLVNIIQEHVEEWFDEADNHPVLREGDLNDPQSALYMSDEQLAAIMQHPLYNISPYFLFGPEDDVIGIVQNGAGFDIQINGTIAAHMVVQDESRFYIDSGSLGDQELVTEILRRILALREL